MSRRTSRERLAPRPAERGGRAATARARRGPVLRSALLVVVALAVGALTLWAAMHWRPSRPMPTREALPLPALIDSVKATERGQDWARLCYWLQRLRETNPRDPRYQLALAMAWHNLSWVGAPSARARSATRTSLERITTEKRVLAMMDSSAANARTPKEWAQAQYWSGVVHENLGLTTDALRIYTGIQMRAPSTTPALAHAVALMNYLRNPQPPPAPAGPTAPATLEAAEP